MKYALMFICLLFMCGCEPPSERPKYTYEQEVVIAHGFYRGRKGTIVSMRYADDRCYDIAYVIDIHQMKDIVVCESDIE